MDNELGLGKAAGTAALAACGAEILTLPFDTVKVRMQLSPGNTTFFRTLIRLITEESVTAPWKGLFAGLQRQISYGTLRISFYIPVRDYISKMTNSDANSPSFGAKVASGMVSGGTAMLIASPTDLLKVRMQGSAQLTSTAKPRYTSTYNAYSTIIRTEGFKSLWTGAGTNAMRCCIINACELAAYDQFKEFLLHKKIMNDGVLLHTISGFFAGFCALIFGSPFDVTKTRMMNAVPGTYRNVFDAIFKTVRSEGFLAFYKGFGPNVLRLGSFNVALFVLLEQSRNLIKKL